MTILREHLFLLALGFAKGFPFGRSLKGWMP
jgi:hypothetical protein